jgi:serine/threonine-protein kinase HipA
MFEKEIILKGQLAALCLFQCSPRGGDLFRYLLEKFAAFSGISGVQPKILVRDEKAFAEMEHTGDRLSQSYKGATHIVKLWEANEYPQLAANEYFCLTVARKYGLDVPPYRLAEDGMALVIDRFDLRMDGTYRAVAQGGLSKPFVI